MGDGWDLGGSPVLRSFPASSFSSVGTGAAVGGDYFVSFNLTASMPFWVRPLVPSDVTSDPFVRMGLNGQLDSAENMLQTAYKIADPAHQRAVASSRPS